MKIQVTKEDIDTSTPCNSLKCAVSRAVNRKLGQFFDKVGTASGQLVIKVFVSDAGLNMKDEVFWFKTPRAVADFIAKYDDQDRIPRGSLEPFEFKLEPAALKERAWVGRIGLVSLFPIPFLSYRGIYWRAGCGSVKAC